MLFKNENKKLLLKNTIMLYILNFSTYLISFALVPYQSRVLQPKGMGLVGLASAMMVYFQLFIDFGFLLSATQEVSENRSSKQKLSEIFTSITLCKLFLISISFVALSILIRSISQWRDNMLFLTLSFFATSINSLLPDYLYRGMEKMSVITFRAVIIKIFFAVMVFFVVKEPDDYILIPILNILGNSCAVMGVYIHLYSSLNIRFTKCKLRQVFKRFKVSSFFFLSRIATTMYTAANTIILDLISGGTMTAYYTSADRLVSTAKTGVAPISDSLYPYMIKNRDFKLVKKIILIAEPVIFIGCLFVFIWAKPACVWFFGEQYAGVAEPLRALLPVVAAILPSYIFGFPVLGAMGLNKHANYSTIYASIFHILMLVVLYFSNNMNIITLAISTSVTEWLILIYRLVVVVKYRNRLIVGERSI